jgi:hypothetical protein
MAIPVVKFSRGDTNLEWLAKNLLYSNKNYQILRIGVMPSG